MALDLGTLAAKLTIDDTEAQAKLRAVEAQQPKITVDTSNLKYVPPDVLAAGAAAGSKYGSQFKGQAAPKVESAVADAGKSAAAAGAAAGGKYGSAFTTEAKSKMSGVNTSPTGGASAGAESGVGAGITSKFAGIAAAVTGVGMLAQKVGGGIQTILDGGMAKASAYADMLLNVKKNSDTLTNDQAFGWRQIGGMVRDMQGDFAWSGKSFATWGQDVLASLVGMKGPTAVVTEQFTQLDDAVQELGATKVAPEIRQITDQLVSMNMPAQKILDLLPKTSAALHDQAHQLGVGSLQAEDYVAWMGGKVPAAVLEAAKAQPKLAEQLGITTAATNSSTAATEKNTTATQKATSAIQKYLDKITALANKQLELRGDRRAFQAAIDDATQALWKAAGVTDKMIDKHGRLSKVGQELVRRYRDSGNAFDINTEKGRTNQEALDTIAESGLAVAQSLAETDKTGKKANAQIAATRTAFIKAATSMGMARDAAVKLADKLGLIKDKKVTVTWQEIHERTKYSTPGAGHSQVARATGGKIPGVASGDHDDHVPVLATPDEWMIQRRAARYYGDTIMAALNAGVIPREVFTMRADGGKVGGSTSASTVAPLHSGRTTNVNVTNYFPRQEPQAITTIRALELAAMMGR